MASVRLSIVSAMALASAPLMYGCGPRTDAVERGSPPPSAQTDIPQDGVLATDVESGTLVDARPAALVDGRAISWGELRPILNEMAGVQALEETILDRLLDRELRRLGLVITDDDIAAERRRFTQALDTDPQTAVRLLDELRERERLGPIRFHALLRRNAALRLMVQEQVSATEDAARRMHDIVHGPQRQARILTVPTMTAARDARLRITEGADFADVAVEVSTDSSAARGGLLEPFAREDATYPQALRDALWSLSLWDVSTPILYDGQYVVMQLVTEVPADGVTYEQTAVEMRDLVRSQQERLLMNQLARRLLSSPSVTIFDRTLDEGWDSRRRRGS